MRLEEMERQQRSNAAPVIQHTMNLLEPYQGQRIGLSLWRSLMLLLFGVVYPASKRSADISRRFYDEERERVFPGVPRNDVFLVELPFEKFLEDMDEVYEYFRTDVQPDGALYKAGLRAARTVENSGRLQTMVSIEEPDPFLDEVEFVEADEFIVESPEEDDPPPKPRKARRGWARVATGAETCGWCLMLCSRGPVYKSEQSAGVGADWHTGCDCAAVPVFDSGDWPGIERYEAAQKMWVEATEDGLRGQDAINALRRAASRGRFQELLEQV